MRHGKGIVGIEEGCDICCISFLVHHYSLPVFVLNYQVVIDGNEK